MPAETITGRVARKYMAHYIDANFSTGDSQLTVDYFRIGKELEEYTVEMNPDTESVKNILGDNTFKHNGYEPSADADPYYANTDDPLFPKLQSFIDDLVTDDRMKTTAVEVHLWDQVQESGSAVDNTFVAYQQECYVVPTSYGGDTSGYQIPFTVNYVGSKTKGKFNTSTKTFTAD